MIDIFGIPLFFANSGWLWALLLLPLIYFIRFFLKKRIVNFYQFSYLPKELLSQKIPKKVLWKWIPDLFILLSMMSIIIALARPQTIDEQQQISANGIDIVICKDVSQSMMAEDFKPNRLEASKELAQQFILNRPSDRIGLVIFSGESFTQCPLTLDHRIILEQLSNVKNGVLRDGTAIGNGLATAIDRVKDGNGKSKVIILMTDGEESKMGGNTLDPLTALEIAKTFGIKVYTIGVGSIGKAITPIPTQNGGFDKRLVDVRIDEPLLKKIAVETEAKYFRATNNSALEKIFDEIDKLEKTKIDTNSFKNYNDLFPHFLVFSLLALLISVVLKITVFRMITD